MKELRELMGLDQPTFASRLSDASRDLDLGVSYDKAKVSKIETGVRDLSLEDVAAIERIAPKGAGGWFRVAFGKEPPAIERPKSGAPRRPAREPQRRRIIPRVAEDEG